VLKEKWHLLKKKKLHWEKNLTGVCCNLQYEFVVVCFASDFLIGWTSNYKMNYMLTLPISNRCKLLHSWSLYQLLWLCTLLSSNQIFKWMLYFIIYQCIYIQELLVEAHHRWLHPAEILKILRNYQIFKNCTRTSWQATQYGFCLCYV
jgi:hypothetical protein